ncbi:MAG: hypothetical protein ABIH41_05355 [Nanoarchaeota archaeon]
MLHISRTSHDADLHVFRFHTAPNVHSELIGFLDDLEFSEGECERIDTPFTNLDNEHICVRKGDMKIHFFITSKETCMVVDTDMPQGELAKVMSKRFE